MDGRVDYNALIKVIVKLLLTAVEDLSVYYRKQ